RNQRGGRIDGREGRIGTGRGISGGVRREDLVVIAGGFTQSGEVHRVRGCQCRVESGCRPVGCGGPEFDLTGRWLIGGPGDRRTRCRDAGGGYGADQRGGRIECREGRIGTGRGIGGRVRREHFVVIAGRFTQSGQGHRV